MSIAASNRALHSGDQPPGEPLALRAGPLSMLYDNGDLRYIKFGEVEVIRRIYAAVRDRNWETIPGSLRNVRIDQGRDFFNISYESEHARAEISFVWRGEISGDADGTLRFKFDGEARTTFLKNRIGFCVLHPIRECAGQKCTVEHVDGSTEEAEFPRLVAPEQPVKGIHDLRAIAHEIQPGLRAEVRFEGDLFEMEDQRNWIDASYKTYCTPQRLPYPAEIQAGTRIQQKVTVQLVGITARPSEVAVERGVTVQVEPKRTRRIPPIGLGVSSRLDHYSAEHARKLRELHLGHLRVDLDFTTDWVPGWKHALHESAELGVPLEVALTFAPERAPSLAHLLLEHPRAMKRIAVFTKGAKSTRPETLFLARKLFGELAPIGVGTNADFYQLNQSRPPWQDADFVCWSMNPQVHAFDNLSMMETPEAIPAQIESAREYFPGKPLVVSPITLKPRFNPVATGSTSQSKDALPPEVDLRQRSMFTAAWTLAIIKRLIDCEVEAVTFYETVGWRGVLESDYPAPQPQRFPSVPGEEFPVYHLLRMLGDFVGGETQPAKSSDWRRIEALMLENGPRRRTVYANTSSIPQRLDDPVFGGLLAPYQFGSFDPAL